MAQSRAVIDLKAYRHNIDIIRGMIPKECAIMAVVKGNAYGHGSVAIAQQALAAGVLMLGVATVEEAMVLRQAEIKAPIVVLVQPPEEALGAAIEHNLRLVLSDVQTAEKVGELARRVNKVVPIHCKVDTGMSRAGFEFDDAVNAMRHITHISHIDIEGVATHFATAEDPRDPFTTNQIKLFKTLLRTLDKEGIPYETAHAANSGGIVNFPNSAFDMVRPGLMTYGVSPGGNTEHTPLKPVLRWETRVAIVRNVAAGSTIGYGRTFTAKRPTRAAVLPVGYADGYKFQLGNNADVIIHGKRCPVRGRISMDQIVVDITEVHGVDVGDVATLIGTDGQETITVAELVDRAGTVGQDILSGIGQRVHRVYVS